MKDHPTPPSILMQKKIVDKLTELLDLLGDEVIERGHNLCDELVIHARATSDLLEKEKMRLEMMKDDYIKLGHAYEWAMEEQPTQLGDLQ